MTLCRSSVEGGRSEVNIADIFSSGHVFSGIGVKKKRRETFGAKRNMPGWSTAQKILGL